MLKVIFELWDGPKVIASFSGAMLFIVTQQTFKGKSRLSMFLISFLMGNIGADTTVDLVHHFFPDHPSMSPIAGAFICGALVVTVSMLVITRVESYLKTST
jgi:hypothetical protein